MTDIDLVKLKIANAHLISDQLKELALSSVAESIFESVIENENGKEIQFECPISDVVFAAHCSIDGLIEQLEAAQRERDNWIEKSRANTFLYFAMKTRAELAEAELKRRDGQKPVAAESRFIDSDWSPCSVEHVEMVQRNPNEWVGYEARLLYDSPVAVPGKVVKLPEKYAVSNDRSELLEKSAVMVALDAAGVKWVEGE